MKIRESYLWALLPILLLVAGTAFAGVQRITECGTVIDEPGSYKLKNDLLDCPGGGIEITSSNVTLDLMGNEITCFDGGTGVGLMGTEEEAVRNVTVKKGHISNCSYGIIVLFAEDSKIMNMTSSANHITGIAVWVSSNIVIMKNQTYANRFNGIESWGSSGNLFKHNSSTDNGGDWVGSGVDFTNETNSQIMCNRIHGNADGILLAPSEFGNSSGNLLHGNLITDNHVSGIGMMGIAEYGELLLDIPAGNTVRSNIVGNNVFFDFFEFYYDTETEDFLLHPNDICMNTWDKNQFGVGYGPTDCFGVPIELEDVCALDDDD